MSTNYCEKCGAALPNDAVFCEQCGARAALAAPPPSSNRRSGGAKAKKGVSKPLILFVILAAATLGVLWLTGVIGGDKPPANAPAAKPTAEVQQPVNTPDRVIVTAAPSSIPAVTLPDLSTTDVPSASDFTWFTENADGWIHGIVPSDSADFARAEDAAGSWKGLQMIIDYDGTLLGCGFFTATLTPSGSDVSALLHWHYIEWSDGTREALDTRSDETMSGAFAYSGLTLGVPGDKIDLLFYELDGRQYAEGVWTVQSGEEVRVALVRP